MREHGHPAALALAVLVWCHTIAAATKAQLGEFLNAGCSNRTAYTALSENADWSQGKCIGPVERTELTGGGGTFTLSLRMVCAEGNTVIYEMFATSSDCSGKAEKATLSAAAIENLFKGKCVAFQPKIQGIPELYMRFNSPRDLTRPCSRDATTTQALSLDSSAMSTGSSDEGGLLLSPETMEEGLTTTEQFVPLRHPTGGQHHSSARHHPQAHDGDKEEEEQAELDKINSAGLGVTASNTEEEGTAAPKPAPEPPKPEPTPAPVVVEPSASESATPAPAPFVFGGKGKKRGHHAAIPVPDLSSPCDTLADLTWDSSRSPVAEYLTSLTDWLRDVPQQAVIAGVAGAIGILCAWNGTRIWQFLFTAAVAAIAAGVVHSQTKDADITSNAVASAILMVEVAIAVSAGVFMGFEGSQVLFGCFIGFVCASRMASVPMALDNMLKGLSLLWYTLGAILGLLVFTVGRRYFLAAFAPHVGGLLVASCIGMFASLILNSGEGSTEAADFFPAPDEAWIDAAGSLLGPNPGLTLGLLCGFAFTGLQLYFWKHKVLLAVVTTVLGILAAIVAWLLSSGCKPLVLYCPEEAPWKWFLLGCVIWVMVAAGAQYKQLGDMPLGTDKEKLEEKETQELFSRICGKEDKIQFKEFKMALQNGVIAPGSPTFQTILAKLFSKGDSRTAVPGYMKLPQAGAK